MLKVNQNNKSLFQLVNYNSASQKSLNIPYVISKNEGIRENQMYFKNHPRKTYGENSFVKWITKKSESEILQILETMFNSPITDKSNYTNKAELLSNLKEIIMNVEDETGSWERKIFYYINKFNLIYTFVGKPITETFILRNEKLKYKQSIKLINNWIDYKKIQITNCLTSDNDLNVIDEIKVDKKLTQEPIFRKIKYSNSKKEAVRRFKNNVNKIIGLDKNDVDDFIDYCFCFNSEDICQFEKKHFLKPSCNPFELFNFLLKCDNNQTNNLNIALMLSSCFTHSNQKGYSKDYLKNNKNKISIEVNRKLESLADTFLQ